MPTNANRFDFDCAWHYGFNLNPRETGCVGYLLFWSGVGGMNLGRDIEVWNPYGAAGQTVVTGEKITCVGLIEKFRFEGGDEDPIRISAYVSKGTASDVRSKLARPLSSTKVKVGWYVIDYDDERKGWYEASLIKGATSVDAIVDTADGQVQMFVDTQGTRISETLEMKVYRFEFQIVPAAGKTALLEFASGPAQRLVKQWGGG